VCQNSRFDQEGLDLGITRSTKAFGELNCQPARLAADCELQFLVGTLSATAQRDAFSRRCNLYDGRMPKRLNFCGKRAGRDRLAKIGVGVGKVNSDVWA